jgi:sigma-B regulation protein RsbU (phosphoserine phosphatase)
MAIMQLKTRSLAFRLILSILTATVLLISGMLYYNYYFSKQLLLESARETARQLTKATMNRVISILISTERVPESLRLYLDDQDAGLESIQEMQKFGLQNKIEVFGSAIAYAPYAYDPAVEAYSPYCYRKDNKLLFKNLADEDYDYFSMDWYTLPRDAGRGIWTEPYFDKGGGNILMATYSMPFYRIEKGERVFRGVVTADLSLDWLETLMNSLKVFETGYVVLVSEKGTVITHPVKEFQMRNLRDLAERAGSQGLTKIAAQMMNTSEGYFPFNSLIDKRACWMYYATLPETNWHMGVVFTESELFAGLQQLYLYTLLIGMLGIIMLSVVVILFASQITKPLRRLTHKAIEIGAGNFDVEIGEDRSTKEISQLGNALSRMQSELKDYIRNLEVTTKAKERFESELNIAHEIQQGMIPKIFPPFPNREDVDIYAILEPARQVGGDLYDFFFLDKDTLCFAIGDVSDKGVPASLMMAITITLFRADADKKQKVNEIVGAINNDVSKENTNLMFITFFLGILNMKTGELDFCNAGHNYPLLLRKNGKLEMLGETHGLPLGINEGQVYQSGKIIIEKNETLVLYSDGITEAMNQKGELYGDDRFQDFLLDKCGKMDPRQITHSIMHDVSGFADTPERSDDITLLVLSYYPSQLK